MKQERKSKNVEFDIVYDNGEKVRVKEGILFEAKEDNSTMLHLGTSRASVVNAFLGAAVEFAEELEKSNTGIVKDHNNHNVKYKKIHTCRLLRSFGLRGIKIAYIELRQSKGWYLIDQDVKVEGQDGANYGTAIVCCPFCGEKL